MSEKKYSKKHEWVSLNGDSATVGISKHATEMLGDIVFVELPEKGKSLNKDDDTRSMHRKASASPTVYKGTVYYPIYEPPAGKAACGVGKAFICSADDECGTNTSENISYAQKTVGSGSRFNAREDGNIIEENEEGAVAQTGAGSGCYYLQPGILSRLVVYGDTLFANITTSSEDQEDTLISLLSDAGEIELYKGSWRENY